MLISIDNIVNKQMVQQISLDTRFKQFTGIQVRDMPFLKTGVTEAHFRTSGNSPVCKETLKITDNGRRM